MAKDLIRAHVFSNIFPFLFFKQNSGNAHILDGVEFTIGLEVPEDIDVLIVYTRASYSIPVDLPRVRTVFVAGEPDVIHKYSAVFLNQFGQVLTSSEVALDTIKHHENYCHMWFAGVDFSDLENPGKQKGIDYFKALDVPEKVDKISVVTSNKTYTQFHQERLEFLEAIRDLIPDRVDFFGRGFKSIDDKMEALAPYKYHIALENGGGRFSWTEKLSDPLMCWTFPFYHGCENAHDELPGDAFQYLDISNPETAARQMVEGIENGIWEKRLKAIGEARETIMDHYNIMKLFVRLAHNAMALPVPQGAPQRTLLRSERSLPTGPGERGSTGERLLRAALLKFDPKIELRMAALQRKIEARRIEKRKKRLAKLEQEQAEKKS